MKSRTGSKVRHVIRFFILMTAFVIIRMFLRLTGLRFSIVNPRIPAQAEAALGFYELRDAVFAQKYGGEEPRGQERDQYDHASIFLTVTRYGKIVAGCRIIHRNLLDGQMLPVETYLGEESRMTITQDAVEVSRMINTLGNNRMVFFGLHLAVFGYLAGKGFPMSLATIRKNYLELILRKRFGDGFFERLSGSAVMVKSTSSRAVTFVPVRIHF